jgi:MFS family permease
MTEQKRTRKRTMSSSFRDRAGSNAKEFFHPNMNLLPLKFTLFFFNGASFAIMPYLTIHMKDIGINDVDIALMYAILPFCVFIAPPIVGFFADKLGNYTRALLMSIIGCAIFHTLLLAVPTNLSHVDYPHTTLTMKDTDVSLKWAQCEEKACSKIRNPEVKEKDPLPIFFEMNNCTLDCPELKHLMVAQAYLGIAVTYESMICGQLGDKHCKVWPGQKKAELVRVNTNVTGNDQCGEAQLNFFTDSDPCITNDLSDETILGINPECDLSCDVRTNLVERCGDSNSGNRLITNGVYFIFRMMATMSLASCFILLDAQTIQLCAVEEKHGKVGAYGRQILYKTLAQAVISPLVGALMDYITAQQGQPNYVASFIIADILFLISFVCALKCDMDLELPVNKDAMGGLKAILTNFEILLFLVMMFVCGSMYGFVETFLFVFLKEDLHAPMYLLGLTITTGAVVSLPFLYYSDAIVKKLGVYNSLVWTLLMYGVRYLGYSYTN